MRSLQYSKLKARSPKPGKHLTEDDSSILEYEVVLDGK